MIDSWGTVHHCQRSRVWDAVYGVKGHDGFLTMMSLNSAQQCELLFQLVSEEDALRFPCMHRSIAGHNPYNLFVLTKYYSKNIITRLLLTKGHMSMFVVTNVNLLLFKLMVRVMDLSIAHAVATQ